MSEFVLPTETDAAVAREAARRCHEGAAEIGKAREALAEKHGKKAGVVRAYARIETTGFRIAKLYEALAEQIDEAQRALEQEAGT